MGAVRAHARLHRFGMHGAAIPIDVRAVRLGVDRHDLAAKLSKQPRRDIVGGAVCAIHDDFHAVKAHAARKRGFEKLNVAAARVIHAIGLAHLCGLYGLGGLGNRRLNALFHFVGKLIAVRAEELDAVIAGWVV